MDLILLLLHLKRHFLVLVGQILQLELNAIVFRLDLPVLVFEILEFSLVLEKLIVFLQLQRVTIPSDIISILHIILGSPLGFIEFSSELLDEISIPTVISFLLESLILKHELLNFTLKSIFEILNLLFILIFLSLKLSP